MENADFFMGLAQQALWITALAAAITAATTGAPRNTTNCQICSSLMPPVFHLSLGGPGEGRSGDETTTPMTAAGFSIALIGSDFSARQSSGCATPPDRTRRRGPLTSQPR